MEQERRDTDPRLGLSSAQAAEQMAAGLDNRSVEAHTKTVGQIILGNTFTFFNLIFVVLAACLFLVGSFHNMLFLVIAVANTLIGIIQEIRSKRVLDKLTLLNAPRATVIRDGVAMTIATEGLVQDDVVEFSAGNQIGADAVVLTGEVQVNEALLTGEPDTIPKAAGAELLSGSFVVAGTCRAQLTRVGAESYAAQLTLEAKKGKALQKSEMMHALDKLIRFIGFALIPVGIALFCKQYFFLDYGLRETVASTVGALIGMIPEGLYLLTSVALAVSVLRLAQKKTLVHEMSCIETLARVDVLCVDKTGTITEPGMQVAGLVPLDEEAFPALAVETVLGAIYAASQAENDTGRAMAERFQGGTHWVADKIIPFTSATKWSALSFGAQGHYAIGAPEFIMGPGYEALRESVELYSAQGERVLLLAKCSGFGDEDKALLGPIAPMALVRISNRIRPEAPDTFRYFAQQGVAIKVISGDSPLTVSQVALRAGVSGAEHWVDAATLTDDGLIAEAANRYTVFGRVTPDQKRKLVRAMQAEGHTVAMTGDGVNDVLALKDANVGIAMASGSDAACQAAQLVLLSSDFSALPEVVLEGRRVINNIQRASSLFLVKNIFSFFLAIITLFVAMPYPLQPIQLSLVGALTIGIPSFFLALEPNRALVKGRFLHNVLKKACPGGFTNLLLVLGVELFAFAFGFDHRELSTLATMLIGFNGLLILYQVCKPFDCKRRLLWWGMTLAMAVAVFFLGGFFFLVPLTLRTALVFVVLLLLGYPCQRLILKFMRYYSRIFRRRMEGRS